MLLENPITSINLLRAVVWPVAVTALIPVVVTNANGAHLQSSPSQHEWGHVSLESSDKTLVDGFNWAKSQALAYVFTGDPVGDWYEAALPGRSAFCMRDVCHQSIGAQVLGLAAFNHNMLRKFALSIAASRDWCGFLEIDKYDRPAPVDYKSDTDFWYNLPANFDVLNACYRVYLWTGDRTYIEDPVFINFYQRALDDYIRKWDKDGDGIPESYPQYRSRGIGSYNEQSKTHIKVGCDLVASEYAAYAAYSQIARLRNDTVEADTCAQKAARLRGVFDENWWDKTWEVFYTALLSDGSMDFQQSSSSFPLWFGIIPPGVKLRHELDLVTHLPTTGVEEMSYIPEIAYRHGRDERAYTILLALMDPGLKRREYPEVSFSVIRTIAVGLMGIEPDAPEGTVTTRPHLTQATAWVKIRDVPVFRNEISLFHRGCGSSTFVNQKGPAIKWKATFPGRVANLIVDGKALPSKIEEDPAGQPESYVIVDVSPGQQMTVRVHGVWACAGGARFGVRRLDAAFSR
jgi:hypothetical protein